MPAHIGYATPDATTPLAPMSFDRGPVGAEDVRIDIAYCGVCHSDVHQARDEFGGALATNFPCMPGHEIVGQVVEVGSDVTKYRVGDRVGVGCLVYWGAEDQRDVLDEQYQNPPAVFTYNTPDPDSGAVTFGGYSDEIVVHEHFALKIPDALPSDQAAPILCAGVTTWAPLKRFEVGAGMTIGVAGIGGLGHMAIQLARARGVDTIVALTTDAAKKDAALALGADDVVVMSDPDQLDRIAGSLDLILTTIPTAFDFNPYLGTLRPGGTLVTVGMLEPVHEGAIDFGMVAQHRLTISASLIGNLDETQEVLDFCAEHDITADIEIIDIADVNDAFDNMVANEVRFRYVIDNSTLDASSS